MFYLVLESRQLCTDAVNFKLCISAEVALLMQGCTYLRHGLNVTRLLLKLSKMQGDNPLFPNVQKSLALFHRKSAWSSVDREVVVTKLSLPLKKTRRWRKGSQAAKFIINAVACRDEVCAVKKQN